MQNVVQGKDQVDTMILGQQWRGERHQRINGGDTYIKMVVEIFFGVTDGERMLCSHNIDENRKKTYFERLTPPMKVSNLLAVSFFEKFIYAAIYYTNSWQGTKFSMVGGP